MAWWKLMNSSGLHLKAVLRPMFASSELIEVNIDLLRYSGLLLAVLHKILINTLKVNKVIMKGISKICHSEFLTPLMLCVLILYTSGGTYSLKSILSDRFLRNFSWQFCLPSRAFVRNLLRGRRQEEIFESRPHIYLLPILRRPISKQ